jgi:hypothetical protein
MQEDESIARVWERIAPRIVPTDASPGLREDMKTCFFAGGLAVLTVVDHLDNAPPLAACFLLHELRVELHAFADERKRAYAATYETDSHPNQTDQE